MLINSHYISSYSDFVVFHPPQRKLPFHVTLTLNGISLNQEHSIKYLAIITDSNFGKVKLAILLKRLSETLWFKLAFVKSRYSGLTMLCLNTYGLIS